ncbi:MAG: DUF4390 domain-containing protein [Nitrospirota bacterium]|nr:MAG: DUF4390 domain-containing protein [Nitrospirota bacterium]
MRITRPLKAMQALLLVLILFASIEARGAEIGTAEATIINGLIKINANLVIDPAHISDLDSGFEKEYIFYIDLFRSWTIWPDEFISGTRIIRKIKSDPVKKEYSVRSSTNGKDKEHRFNSLESMLSEALIIKDLALADTRTLLPGDYYVKVSALSRIRKLAPIVSYLLFFIPDEEFRVEKLTSTFKIQKQ